MRELSLVGLVILGLSSIANAQPKKDAPKPAAATGTVSGTVKVTDEGKEVKGVEVVVYVVGPPDMPGKEVVGATIKQTADRKFIPDLVAVTQNEKVEFPNTGATLHNVFSQKPKFDLGQFDKGQSKSYTFKDGFKGTAEIYCNIHPEMAATVLVLPNPYHASAKDGKFTIPNVPVGKWTVFAYTRRATAPAKTTVDVTASGGTADLTITRGAETKHLNKYGEQYKKTYP